ncbi:MAG: AbrB/MazE/SpoVT family DNA-binding domain-containing protein [Acutalibacteraceae bacterium]
MKETGIIRTLDNMGRVVIPREIRKQLDMVNGVDSFEIFMDGDNIVLKKHNPNCVFCNSEESCVEFENQVVCKACIEKLHLKVQESETIE